VGRLGDRARAVISSLAQLLLVFVLLAGCATLTPAQEKSAGEVRALAERTARLYGRLPLYLFVSHDPHAPPGSFRRGYFTVSKITLLSTFRDAIVAHELAHYVLGHDAPLGAGSLDDQERDYQQRELEANAKAVEILTRAAGVGEGAALRIMYDYLAGVQWALERYPRLDLRGHKLPCEEMTDLLARFPRQRPWTASLECAPADVHSGG